MNLLPAVLHELDIAGYALIGEGGRSHRRISLDKVLEAMLSQYRDDVRLINGVPILLSKADDERLSQLYKIPDDIVNPTGYLVETTAKALRRINRGSDAQRLDKYISDLWRRTDQKSNYTIPYHHGKAVLHRLSKRRSAIARKWNVIDYNRESEFEELLRRYS